MPESDINPFFTIKKVREGDELKMDQKFIKIRMNSNKVMAIHYKAPMERTIELEMFFEDFNPIDRINYDIGGTTKKVHAKICSNDSTLVFISHASKEMLKILQARLQLYVN